MPKKIDKTEILDRMTKKHDGKYKYDLSSFVNTRSVIRIECPVHGYFEQKCSDHLYAGCGCPKCDTTRRFTTEDFIRRAVETHADKYDYSKSIYGKNNYDKVIIVCKEHGEFLQTPFAHMKGQGCPKCANNTSYSTDEFIKLCVEKHGNLYDYSKLDYKGKKEYVTIVCKKHGEFQQLARLHADGYGCKKCKMSKLEIWVKALLEERKIRWEYSKKFESLKWKKPLSFDFWLPDYRIAIECDGIQHREAVDFFGGETRLEEQIHKDNIKTEWCIENKAMLLRISDFVDPFELIDSNLIDKFSHTIVNEKKNLVKFERIKKTIFKIDDTPKIELLDFIKQNAEVEPDFSIDGEPYIKITGSNLVFKYIDFFSYSEINVPKRKLAEMYHSCNNNGYKLVQIFEDDWRNRNSIVKSRIQNLLGKSQKIWARKCVIKEITEHGVLKDFLDKTHIQGFVASKYKIGIYHQEELVAILTLSDLRINLGQKKEEGTFEILRYSCKNGINVIGGFDKGLKYFIKKYSPKKIVSYANMMWSNENNVYSKLGMKLESISDPSYFYVVGDKREGRFSFRKDVLLQKWGFPATMTEHTIMLANSVYRIFDAGCFKYSLQIEKEG
jgi:hypothetical protein